MKHAMLVVLALGSCTLDEDEDLTEITSEAACGAKLPVAAFTASGAQNGNPAANALDGNLATRWSQLEIGATLTLDLGALKSVCAVSVAWHNGASRTSQFTIGVSKTGASYEQVVARASSGTTTALEAYTFTPRDVRYVRLTVNGNSESDWASVTEIEVAGGPASKLTRAQRDALVYGNYKPSAASVGPVPEVTLAPFGSPTTSMDVVVSANDQIVENLEIWGRVDLRSFSGVTIRNCIIHGTLLRGTDTAHVVAQDSNLRGATIIDSSLVGRPVTVPASFNGVPNPDAGTVNRANEWVGGLRGGNYTVLRTEITNTADGLGFTKHGNVVAKGNWIHDGWFNEWPESQATPNGGPARYYPYSTGTAHYTHVDGIQFHVGKNYTIVGNRIGGTRVKGDHNVTPSQKTQINTGDDMYNAGLMIKQEVNELAANKIENVLIDRNWLEGGVATINITYGLNNRFESVTVSNNKFPRSTWGEQWYILRHNDPSGTPVGNFSNNVFEDDGTPVPIKRGN